MTSLQTSLTQASLTSLGGHLHRPADGGHSPEKWKIQAGFRKLQRRINERQRSGRSSGTGVIRNHSLPPLSWEERRRSARCKAVKVSRRGSKTGGGERSGGQSEASLQYELYRTSNNGLIRMLNTRQRKSHTSTVSGKLYTIFQVSSLLN